MIKEISGTTGNYATAAYKAVLQAMTGEVKIQTNNDLGANLSLKN